MCAAGWGWPASLLFGSLIAATDPVSVIAMMKDQAAPQRLHFLMEAESLVNDGAAGTVAHYKALLAAGWHDEGITGAFGTLFGAHANDWSQLGAQLTGTLTCILFVGAFAWLWFTLAQRFTPMRTNVEEELQGLDIPEMGAEAYPDYQLTDKSSPL